MATADQVKALVRSHAERDDRQFYAVALQVAAKAARQGHTRLATELRDLIDEAKSAAGAADGRHLRPVPVVKPRGELSGLLAVTYPRQRLVDLVVDDRVRDRLKRVLTEQRQQSQLRAHGFEPLHSLLLVGPPGTGKTLSASVLAGELNLPLFMVRLESLITKFMGETAAKLRLIFDAVEETRGVYLFDEVDALAGDRASGNDVGEVRRILNSFLQFLDHDQSSSVVVAATNNPQLLDRAVFRRFDTVIEYQPPTADLARRVIKNRLATLELTGVRWPKIDSAAVGLSHAELVIACEHAAKEAILRKERRVTTGCLVAALEERHRSSS